ncbi:hypothetical protein E3E22_08125 [Thermococcus sp. MV5]|uniref:helix-turn-helix domain-containing protein n=1 Tax=Thermococcus sp. MV5 TaxID=1638272 RepID=UPI00143ACBEE|nr:helix-turn-helix domain-containing protein [Thermococcus sp. MV5]NJE26581.1 hypothetical protein [Thermococcus sp. MV5]
MRVITLDMWQPDCPIVYLSEVIKDPRFYVIMPHVVGEKTRVFITVPSNNLKSSIRALKNHNSVRMVRVLWTENEISGVEIICKTTNAMDTFLHSEVIFQRAYFAQNGYERWGIIVENKKAEKEVIQRLKEDNEIHILHKERISTLTPALLMVDPPTYLRLISLLEVNLSETQRKILDKTLEKGYYEYPRRTTLKKIADDIGISKVTALKNLRRMEEVGMKLLAELIRIKVFGSYDLEKIKREI